MTSVQGIKHLTAKNIFGYLDFDLPFNSGVNIIYGANGAGKTTLLHIIANLSNMDLHKFGLIKFHSIHVEYYNGVSILLRHPSLDESVMCLVQNNIGTVEFSIPSVLKKNEMAESNRIRGREALNSQISLPFTGSNIYAEKEANYRGSLDDLKGLPKVTYFPAFRGTMAGLTLNLHQSEFDRTGHFRSSRIRDRGVRQGTVEKYLGAFVPKVDFVTTVEISDELEQELFSAERHVYMEMKSTYYDTFEQAITSIIRTQETLNFQEPQLEPQELLETIQSIIEKTLNTPIPFRSSSYANGFRKIQHLLESTHRTDFSADVSRVLEVYLKAFETNFAVIDGYYKVIQEFMSIANKFLGEKSLVVVDGIKSPRASVQVKLPNGDTEPLSVLSSGEREIVSMLYAVTHLSSYDLVLIDEPELSLHIDWQRILLKKMVDLIGSKQVIACTHSPQIGADFDEIFSDGNFHIYGFRGEWSDLS